MRQAWEGMFLLHGPHCRVTEGLPYQCAFSVIPRVFIRHPYGERFSTCSLAPDETGRVRAGFIDFSSRREGGCTIFRTGCLVMRQSQLNGKAMEDGVA